MARALHTVGLIVALTLVKISDGQDDHSVGTMGAFECGLWLAPSTIPGSGLGMFAGRNFSKGEELAETGDIIIPVVDIEVFTNGDKPSIFLWDEYMWSSDTLAMDHEGVSVVSVASPGFGSMANSFLDLQNVDERVPECDAAGVDRTRDPGAGAFSHYHNRISVATDAISVGQELFVSYGDNWFLGRSRDLGPIPIKGDLPRADTVLKKYHQLRQLYNDTISHVLKDLWETFVMKSPFLSTSREFFSFPSRWEELETALEMGLVEFKKYQSTVSEDWLQSHGTCIDNIRAAPSTIQQAGRGAFATRFIPKDSVVAALPLVHVANRTKMEIYKLEHNNKSETVAVDKQHPVSHQLLQNYCFGHSESTLLLCSYGLLTGAVNHNRTLANTKVQWSDPSRSNHHPDWLNLTIRALSRKKTAGLQMDYIATRDIQPGEEIFLDYGHEWEVAWNRHVQTWKPPEGQELYRPAAYFNNRTNHPVLRTEFDQMYNPYPPNVQLKCRTVFYEKSTTWESTVRNEIDFDVGKFVLQSGLSRCDVLRWEWHDDILGIVYTAVFLEANGEKLEEPFKLANAPRDAFFFVDRAYTSDMHLPNAFRHEMMIPDDIFPEKWRNKRNHAKRGKAVSSPK